MRLLPVVLLLSLVANGLGAAGPRLVVESDSRPVFLVHPFCFEPGGNLNLKAIGVKIDEAAPPEDARAGFIIMKADGAYSSNAAEYAATDGECLLDDGGHHEVVVLNKEEINYERSFTESDQGHYYILFVNCNRNTVVSFDMTLMLTNAHGEFLPAGDLILPTAFGFMTVVFFIAGFVWIWAVKSGWESVHKIHLLMLALVFVKAIALGLEAIRYHYLMVYDDGFGWTTAFYIFTFLKGAMLFGVILLIGTGLFILKPFLNDRDKKIILVVLPLQVMVNIAMVMVEETPPGTAGWLTWRDILHLFDIICCCAILFPIVWSIRHLREASDTDGKVARNLGKLKLFREFYIMVVCYIYFTRIIVYLVRATLPCRYTWISAVTAEIATLAFFVAVGYKFRPRSTNPYLMVDSEDGESMVDLES